MGLYSCSCLWKGKDRNRRKCSSKDQGQKKLSQNKTEAEMQRIVAHLEKSDNSVEVAIAKHIRELKGF